MIDISNIRAFIFDMDGTLIDSMKYWRGENRIFLARHGYPVPEGMEHTLDTTSSHDFALYFSSHHPEFTFDGIMAEYYEKLTMLYQTVIPEKPGASEFLEFLRKRNIQMCVATATPRHMAILALKKQGFLDYLSFVTDNEECGMSKGEPEFFIRLAKRLNVQPQECVLFEDSLYAMKSALQTGMTVFAIQEDVYEDKPAYVSEIKQTAHLYVHNFHEVIQQIQ